MDFLVVVQLNIQAACKHDFQRHNGAFENLSLTVVQNYMKINNFINFKN